MGIIKKLTFLVNIIEHNLFGNDTIQKPNYNKIHLGYINLT
jgi:hypothetical protein